MPVGQCVEGMRPGPFGVAKQLDLDPTVRTTNHVRSTCSYVDPRGYRPDLRSLLPVEAERRVGGRGSIETRCFISAIPRSLASVGDGEGTPGDRERPTLDPGRGLSLA